MTRNKLDKQPGLKILKHLVTKDRYFQVGLIVKILLSFFFASAYMTDLFVPFIKASITGNFWSIYNDFYAVKPNAFPYPPLMLYLLAVPRYLATLFSPATGAVSFIDIFCLKIPLLFADIALTVVLIKWLRNVKQVLIWYWFSPVIIYVSYIHGQLDIIPTALLCIALNFLFKEQFKYFVLFLAFACATKFHIVMTFPLFIIYLYRSNKIQLKNLLVGIPVFVGLLLLLNLPFLFQPGFIKMVYQNHEQNKVFASFFNLFANYRLIFIPASYMIILYIMADFKFVNKDILLIFLALSFGIITFFLVPQPGWYLWNIPFFIYFLIRFNFRAKPLFIILNVAYFLFFITYPESDFPQVAQLIAEGSKDAMNFFNLLQSYNINGEIVVQLCFTFLQIALLLFCISLFRLGVLQIRRYKIYYQPYLIGISGDSGTGKSTLTRCIKDLFGTSNSLVVQGDDMHRWERGHEKWNELTHLNPMANWLHRDLSNLIDLKEGKRIMRRNYDHGTGRFTPLSPVDPNKIIIYEGLHTFYLKEASKIYDLKIFMKPSEELRRYWKVERDVKSRGYAMEKVIESIEKRIPDSNKHILNQEAEADMVFSIEEVHNTNTSSDHIDKTNLCLKITCSNDIFFEHLVDFLVSVAGLTVRHNIDRHKQDLIITGNISVAQIEEIAELLQLDLKEIIGTTPSWSPDFFGIMQLFILFHMLTQFKRTGMLVELETL